MKKGLFRKGKQLRSVLSRLSPLHKTGISVVAIVAVSLAFAALPSLPAHSEPPTDGLVGYWNFDDGTGTTAADSSGNGNNGTLTNMNPAIAWVAGQVGGALSFDGIDDNVDLGDINEMDGASQLTWSAWVYSNQANQRRRGILGKIGNSFALETHHNSDNDILIYMGDSTTRAFKVQKYNIQNQLVSIFMARGVRCQRASSRSVGLSKGGEIG